MNSHDDAAYRLRLSKEYLADAESDANEKRWHTCLANAQEAAENAGKSVLLYFRPIPATHNIEKLLEQLLNDKTVPHAVQEQLRSQLGAFRGMGMKTHVRATYGDEEAHLTPRELIQRAEATEGLDKARRAVALAEAVAWEMNKPADQRE